MYSPGAMTARSLLRPDSVFSRFLIDFLSNNSKSGDSLILSVGEIDIRAHMWRELPILLRRGTTLKSYLQNFTDSLVAKSMEYAQNFKLARIILWGPPPASENGKIYLDQFPFVGDMVTRNILTHLFNISIAESINRVAKNCLVLFATPFYSLIDFSMRSRQDIFFDGLHLDPQYFGGFCWDLCGELVMSGETTYFDRLITCFSERSFSIKLDCGSADLSEMELFDCWCSFGNETLEDPKVGNRLTFHTDLGIKEFFFKHKLQKSHQGMKFVGLRESI